MYLVYPILRRLSIGILNLSAFLYYIEEGA
nr:MAG TPA: hypothetical protein [Caudoviricetes sp.]